MFTSHKGEDFSLRNVFSGHLLEASRGIVTVLHLVAHYPSSIAFVFYSHSASLGTSGRRFNYPKREGSSNIADQPVPQRPHYRHFFGWNNCCRRTAPYCIISINCGEVVKIQALRREPTMATPRVGTSPSLSSTLGPDIDEELELSAIGNFSLRCLAASKITSTKSFSRPPYTNMAQFNQTESFYIITSQGQRLGKKVSDPFQEHYNQLQSFVKNNNNGQAEGIVDLQKRLGGVEGFLK
ncbi:hypothetical protein FDECE_1502 [Fusarium decemcellulare]|nr:hypothetical protein FDECE_1502 [Fusarium decemcellulare]